MEWRWERVRLKPVDALRPAPQRVAHGRRRHRPQCSLRLALCVQRVLAAAGDHARGGPSRSGSRLCSGRVRIRRRNDPGSHRLRARPDPARGAGVCKRKYFGHRARGDGERPRPARHRVRALVRHRWWCRLHRRAAGREPGRCATSGPGERVHRQPVPGGSNDRRTPFRLVHPRVRRSRHAGRTRGRAGHRRVDQRLADHALRCHPGEHDGIRHSGPHRATTSGVLAAMDRLLPGGIRRAHGPQSGRRHHQCLWRRHAARRARHDVHHGQRCRRASGRGVDGGLARHSQRGGRQRMPSRSRAM